MITKKDPVKQTALRLPLNGVLVFSLSAVLKNQSKVWFISDWFSGFGAIDKAKIWCKIYI